MQIKDRIQKVLTNSGLSASEFSKRLDIPLYRLGFPVFDRLGNGQRHTVGYTGTAQLLFDIGNIFLEADEASAHAQVHAWRQGEI